MNLSAGIFSDQDQVEAAVLVRFSVRPDAGSVTEGAAPTAASLWKVLAGVVNRGIQSEAAFCFIETTILESVIPNFPEDQAVYTGDTSPWNVTTEPVGRLPLTVWGTVTENLLASGTFSPETK